MVMYARKDGSEVTPVVITGIDIPFGRLVMLLVKLTLAAIPAAAIVCVIWALLLAALWAIFGAAFLDGLRDLLPHFP
jgi:hypothetical protein